MPVIHVFLHRTGDPPIEALRVPVEMAEAAGQPLLHFAGEWKLAAIEGGMVSGLPSVLLQLVFPQGPVLIAETSLAAWIAATCAIRGAFPEAFRGTPLEGPNLPS